MGHGRSHSRRLNASLQRAVGKLSDAAWQDVFQLRCKSKSGGTLSKAEQALVEAAFQEDETRYGDMEIAVFNATVPFGSSTRREKD